MAVYPRTNILIKDNPSLYFCDLVSELDLCGCPYHQNYNPNRSEYHYFMGDSSILLIKYKDSLDIRIVSKDSDSLSKWKQSLEKILDGISKK